MVVRARHQRRKRPLVAHRDRYGRAVGTLHLAGARTRHHAPVGKAADHHNPLGAGGQGQHAAVILQQHDALLGGLQSHLAIRLEVDRAARLRRVSIDSVGVNCGQHAGIHLVEMRGDGFVLGCGLPQSFAKKNRRVQLSARLLIQPVQRRLHPRHRAPIGHHKAIPAPIALQHLVQQPIAVAAMLAVDDVIGTHRAARMALFDADFKRQQIAFTRGGFGNLHIDEFARGFLPVQREMLDGGDDVVRLNAADRRAHQRSGQQGVLGQIFKRPPIARVARQVRAARQHHVKALGPRLAADHRAAVV